MIQLPLNEVLAKLQEKTGMSEQELLSKIDAKCQALSGLISKEGAAHIIANELGVKLIDASSGKIKDLHPGMRNVSVKGRITHVFDIREFNRADGSTGKVGSFVVGDETGTMRIVCWGDQTEFLSRVQPDQGVEVTSGQVRENNRGYKEVHLTAQSQLKPFTGELPNVQAKTVERKSLKDLQESPDTIEIMGTVVQVFDPKFYEVCPECNTRLKEQEGQWQCPKHGQVPPAYAYLLNVFLDDGTESIRVVLFRDQVEQLIGKSKEELLAYRVQPETFEPVKTDLLGEQYVFVGKAKNNTFFDRIEFIANAVKKATPDAELAKLQS